MSTNKPTVAVIGLGNIGKVVATNLVKGKRQVIVASRNIEEAQKLATELGSLAKATDIPTAIRSAEVIVLAKIGRA